MSMSLSLCKYLLPAALCSLTIGCDAPDDGAEPVEITAVDGLALQIREQRVEGTFTRGDATIDFVIERDGAVRTAVLTASDGSPLLESEAEGERETVSVLGGRAVLSGDPRSPEPVVTGDPGAYDELLAMPEATCIRELQVALTEAGVEPALLGAEPADEVTPRLWNDGYWWHLGPNEELVVGTWGWLKYTHVSVRWDAVPPPWAILATCLDLYPGAAYTQICVLPGEQVTRAYQFWGVILKVRNPSGNEILVRTY